MPKNNLWGLRGLRLETKVSELKNEYDGPSPKINVDMSFILQLDVLQYIHSNEYVHADINAENIYVKPGDKSQVRNIKALHHQLLKSDENVMKSVVTVFVSVWFFLVRYTWWSTAMPSGTVQEENTWSTVRPAKRHTRAPLSLSA